jgi:hypothetical protein
MDAQALTRIAPPTPIAPLHVVTFPAASTIESLAKRVLQEVILSHGKDFRKYLAAQGV